MHPLKNMCADHAGGRVLDVGTRFGDYIGVLHDTIGGITHTTGVDISLESLKQARNNVGSPEVSFVMASALALPFADGTFDTVAMANALHHLPDAQGGLDELLRVLRPGGLLVIAEYITDSATEAQASFIALHDLGGDIARHAGVSHHGFFDVDKVQSLISPLDLSDMQKQRFTRESIDHDPATIQASVDGFSSHLADITGHPSYDRYRAAMTVAHLRATRTGMQRPTQLILTGVKGASR